MVKTLNLAQIALALTITVATLALAFMASPAAMVTWMAAVIQWRFCD